MPIVNGNYYMNGDYGQGLEQSRIADAFPGLAEQTGAGDSWADRLIDHLTTPRSATEPPPPPAPPGMPPEAYDDMKVNDLRGRDVAGIIANEDRDVTPGTSSPEEFYQSKVWKAHAIINGDRTYGDLRLDRVHTAPSEVTPELENSPQYQQATDTMSTSDRGRSVTAAKKSSNGLAHSSTVRKKSILCSMKTCQKRPRRSRK